MEQHILHYDNTLIKKIQIGLRISIKCYITFFHLYRVGTEL